MNEVRTDIFDVANYLVCYASKLSESDSSYNVITPLSLQKLLYFTEALYMSQNNSSQLYDVEFQAWPYGPVSDIVSRRYKTYNQNPIEPENCDAIFECCDSACWKKCADMVYESFGRLSASDLVALTHMNNSPWSRVWESSTDLEKIFSGKVIPKEETREWFSENLMKYIHD